MSTKITQKNLTAPDGTLELPAKYGNIVVLTGTNGAGKSSTLNVIRAALGDKDAVVRRRDDTTPGMVTVELNGIHKLVLAVNNRGRVPVQGALPIRLGDKASSVLPELIGPEDMAESRSKTSCTNRINALATQVALTITPERLSILSGGLSLDACNVAVPFPQAVENIRACLAATARIHATNRDTAAGKLAQLESELAKLPALGPVSSIATARDILANDHRKLFEVEASHKARLDQEKTRAALRADLPEPSAEPLIADIRLLLGQLEAEKPARQFEGAWTPIHRKAVEIMGGVNILMARTAEYLDVQTRLSAPITGATDADLDAARLTVDDARKALAEAEAAALRAEIEPQISDLKADVDLFTGHAKAYESAASRQMIWKRASQILATVGLDAMSIIDGELYATMPDTEPRRFADLSFGERCVTAIEAVAATIPTDSSVQFTIITLLESYWTALCPEFRQRVSDALAAHCGYVQLWTEDQGDGVLAIGPM